MRFFKRGTVYQGLPKVCQVRRSARSPRRFAWFRSFCPVSFQIGDDKKLHVLFIFQDACTWLFFTAQIHSYAKPPPLQSSSLVYIEVFASNGERTLFQKGVQNLLKCYEEMPANCHFLVLSKVHSGENSPKSLRL